MNAILIESIDGKLQVTHIPAICLHEMMEHRGYSFQGLTTSPRLREELQGQPRFSGVLGPMWGGEETPLRYETQEAYNELSQ